MRLGFLLFAVLSSGCVTAFFSTAPAKPGFVYVAGQKAGRQTLFLCPTVRENGKECTLVEIEEME